MTYIYGTNANNQRSLLAAAKAAPAPTVGAGQIIGIAAEVTLAQSLLAQLQADESPAIPSTWKAKV